jgi:hypothetical protein
VAENRKFAAHSGQINAWGNNNRWVKESFDTREAETNGLLRKIPRNGHRRQLAFGEKSEMLKAEIGNK